MPVAGEAGDGQGGGQPRGVRGSGLRGMGEVTIEPRLEYLRGSDGP